MRILEVACVILTFCWIVGCDGNKETADPVYDASTGPIEPEPDADGEYANCGDGIVSPGEECDDANRLEDDECLNDCTWACGDGVVNESEKCDTGVAAGEPGACPTECTSEDPCRVGTLSEDACQTECLYTDITGPAEGDGCCPGGANANTDGDCPVVCGNGVVEEGETCDTSIAAEAAGACPTACDDGQACTADALVDGGTCTASCTNDEITAPANDDSCCPPGATSLNDNDCSTSCGNGVVEEGETCDTSIASGADGACPTACDDGEVCTTDTLLSAGTCNAACSAAEITAPANDDSCCPTGANATNDNDCDPVCGNSVIEPGEDCDPPGDGCDETCHTAPLGPTAFRITEITLKDPHPFTLVLLIACIDIVGNINDAIETAMSSDEDPEDGILDLSLAGIMRPLDQSASETPMDIVFAACTAPVEETTCGFPEVPEVDPVSTTARNQDEGTCLAELEGTTGGYSPAITPTTGPCFVSDPAPIMMSIGGLVIPLENARIAAKYVGDPAEQLVSGLLVGFISEATAAETIIPESVSVVGGLALSSILAGNDDNCSRNDDRDVGPDGVTTGWYFYFNFRADAVGWSD